MTRDQLITILMNNPDIGNCKVAIDDGTEKSPIEIKAFSTLMDGYLLLLTYDEKEVA